MFKGFSEVICISNKYLKYNYAILFMADDSINLPSGYGGLVRFKEEYSSLINLKPIHVIFFLILLVVFRVVLGLVVK